MSNSYCQTFEGDSIKEATQTLILDNAEHLIKFIYEHKDHHPYDKPEVRVGLVLKTLMGANTETKPINGDIVEAVIEELTILRNTTKDTIQCNIYDEELRYLKFCTIHSDMVTLNTEIV
uniref:Uncharacterized protein n=1 Tax=viral metagenome TaxID=1070528 RepID=A0A6C0J7J9_9ZZZZ